MTEGDHAKNRALYGAFWREKCEQFAERLFPYARRLVQQVNVCDPEDLVSITICRALGYSPNPAKVRKPLSYLFRIMHNGWADEVRKRKDMDSLDDPDCQRALEQRFSVTQKTQAFLEIQQFFEDQCTPNSLTEEEIKLLRSICDGETPEEIAATTGEDVWRTKNRCHALKAKLHARVKAEAKRAGNSNARSADLESLKGSTKTLRRGTTE